MPTSYQVFLRLGVKGEKISLYGDSHLIIGAFS